MSHTSMILSALMLLAMVIFMAPGIFALNRGHILRNIALWLGIFLALALFYQNFGPGSPHPLFGASDALSGMRRTTVTTTPAPDARDGKDNNDDGSQSYTPPAE